MNIGRNLFSTKGSKIPNKRLNSADPRLPTSVHLLLETVVVIPVMTEVLLSHAFVLSLKILSPLHLHSLVLFSSPSMHSLKAGHVRLEHGTEMDQCDKNYQSFSHIISYTYYFHILFSHIIFTYYFDIFHSML